MDVYGLNQATGKLRQKYTSIAKVVGVEKLPKTVEDLETKASDPKIWDDPDVAAKVTGELSRAKAKLAQMKALEGSLNDLDALSEMASETTDSAEAEEMLEMADVQLAEVSEKIDELEIRTLMTGEFDELEAVVTIRSGAGGTEAADWAEMLFRMYTRWATRHNYDIVVMDTSYAEEAGMKSATFEIREKYAFGELASEAGTHRLVRISPFNAQGKRQTSFAAVEVIPLFAEVSEIDVPDSDIKVDVFRASGPGGQSVNTTDSAVRITHLPTGITVSMQNEKSQIQNRAAAMRVLQSRLMLLKREQEAAQKKDLAGNITAAWGDQIRNYVLHPYQMVKDTRTLVETAQTSSVLDGNIDEFIRAGVRWRATKSSPVD